MDTPAKMGAVSASRRASDHGNDCLSLLFRLIQLQDAATSAAANYRAACVAQSKAAFIAKLSIALEEADESVGWLQRLSHQRIGETKTVENLLQEAGEISAILTASRQTAQGRRRKPRPRGDNSTTQ